MKKILVFLMCACLAFSLAACSKPQTTSTPDAATSLPAATESQPAEDTSSAESQPTSDSEAQPAEDTSSEESQPSDVSESQEITVPEFDEYPDLASAQEAVGFEFKDIVVDGWETQMVSASPEEQYIQITLVKDDTYVDIYKGAVKDNLLSVDEAFTDGSGDATFDDTIAVTLGRMGGVYTYASWDSDGYTYVIDNPSGMTPDEINTFMEAIMY